MISSTANLEIVLGIEQRREKDNSLTSSLVFQLLPVVVIHNINYLEYGPGQTSCIYF